MAEQFQIVFLSCGAFLHLLYLSSIFYIYFKSPILPGLNSIDLKSKPLANRLVLFVTDGLRADKLFHRNNANISQYLRNIIQNQGRWGVSHTRVPTESRVGHVSMMAGTYEDVSAITNGWKDNPVNFDSLFNQSYNTWSWGSPDILNIFKKQSGRGNFHPFSYDSKEVDFASSDPSLLDKWVFKHIAKFLDDAKSSGDIERELLQPKTVFFLHLLGIDTNGHAKKPDSKEYHENINVVDKGIQKAVAQFEEFFNHDGKTVYVVTSDHGMTSWGAHGTGLPSETETPYIAWGSGVKKPNKGRNINKDSQTMVWGLEEWERVDIHQIDLASLMSFLIGTSFPVNSVGRLPYRILDTSMEEKALGLIHNVRQIRLQYDAHERKVRDSSLFFTPFQGINEGETPADLESLHKSAKGEDVALQDVLDKANARIDILLSGIDYYHRYHRFSLSLCVNGAFIIWLFLLVSTILYEYTGLVTKKQLHRNSDIVSVLKSRLFKSIAAFVTLSVSMMLYWKSKDASLVLYTVLPLLAVLVALGRVDTINDVWVSLMYKVNVKNVLQFVGMSSFILVGLEFLIHAFFDRRSLSIVAVFLAFLPWMKLVVANGGQFSVIHNLVGILFTATSLALGCFPQLPVIHKEENYMLVVLGAFMFATCGMIFTFFVKDRNSLVVASQTALVIFCTVVKLHSVASISDGEGLPWLNQLFSWGVVATAPVLIAITDKHSLSRLLSTILALASVFVLTSISYETLFLVVLALNLLSWVAMEIFIFSPEQATATSRNNINNIQLSWDHFRISFMFVYYIFISFFGTGNVASINSFDIASTYCFQTVFNPLVQGVVLALKVLVPFLMVILVFRSMEATTALPMKALFLVILLLTDIMSMHFFFWVKDEGSWLDIGQSLSHFLINLVFVIFLIPFYKLSYYVTGSISLQTMKSHIM